MYKLEACFFMRSTVTLLQWFSTSCLGTTNYNSKDFIIYINSIKMEVFVIFIEQIQAYCLFVLLVNFFKIIEPYHRLYERKVRQKDYLLRLVTNGRLLVILLISRSRSKPVRVDQIPSPSCWHFSAIVSSPTKQIILWEYIFYGAILIDSKFYYCSK